MGTAALSLGRELYAVSGLARALCDTLLAGLPHLPDHRLRLIVRCALKPLVHHCPPAHLATVVVPVLEHFAPFSELSVLFVTSEPPIFSMSATRTVAPWIPLGHTCQPDNEPHNTLYTWRDLSNRFGDNNLKFRKSKRRFMCFAQKRWPWSARPSTDTI